MTNSSQSTPPTPPRRLRIWWIPQVPMKAFHQDVPDIPTAALLLKTLARYDQFQYENRIKGDYSNTGGLQEFDPEDTTDGPDGSWLDWHCPDTDMDIDEWMAEQESSEKDSNS